MDDDSRRAAASIHAETADPLHTALSDCLEKHDGPDGVTGEEIKERLKSPGRSDPLRHGPSEERCRPVFSVTSTSNCRAKAINKKG